MKQIAARWAIPLAALVATSSLGVGAFASQLEPEAQPWPKREITIRDATAHWASTKLAVGQWNLSRIGLHFKMTSNRQADITVRIGHQSQCSGKWCAAHASWIGYRGRPETIDLMFLTVPDGEGKVDYDTVRIVSHEIGHILGLEHTESCSLMSYNMPKACGMSPLEVPHLCGPDQSSLNLLRKTYGGSGPVRYARGCTALS